MSELYSTHKNLKGTVSWFNAASGEGVVRVNNKNFYIHYSAIIPDSKGTRRVLYPGDSVLVDTLDDNYARHITKCSVIKGE